MNNLVIDKQKLKNAIIFFAVLIAGTVLIYFCAVNPLLGDEAENASYKVSIDILTTVSDTFTLYYDNSDITHFDEAHTKTASVKGSNSYQTVSFEIPSDGVSYLKFSLGTQNNVSFYIRSISIESFSKARKITYDKLESVFDVMDKMSRFSQRDGYVSTRTTKLGASFSNSNPITVKNGKLTLPFISLALAFILQCCVLLTVRLAKKGGSWQKTPEFISVVLLFVSLLALIVFGLFISPVDSETVNYIVRSAAALIIFAVCVIIIVFKLRSAEKKPKISEIATILCFGLIFSFAIITGLFFIPQLSEEYESPDFTLARFMDFSNEYTDQYEKQNPVNTLLSNSYSDLKLFLFADSQYENVVVGKNGWLFSTDELADYKRMNTFSKESLVKIRDTLLNYERTFRGQNIAFYILIVPDKSTVYENMMPSSVRRTSREDRLSQVYDYLWKYSDMNVVEIRDQLISASYDADVYYKTDNYMNQNGAFTATNVLLGKIAANFESIEQLDIDNYNVELGDSLMKSLAMMMNYGNSYAEFDYYYKLKRTPKLTVTSEVINPFLNLSEGETVKEPNVSALFGAGVLAELEAKNKSYLTDNYINIKNTSAENDLHVVVIHDEALLTMVPFIGEAFAESSFILNNGDWTTRSIINEAPDVVIFQISEKYLADFTK